MALLACPFCREMFERSERRTCPVCGVRLVALGTVDRQSSAPVDEDLVDPPEFQPLPPFSLGRGRGVLLVLLLLGLIAFCVPWVHVTIPDVDTYTGLSLARRLGWPWAVPCAWFVLAPIVASRRNIVQMRSARVAAAFLAAIPGTTAAILLLNPPHGSRLVPLRFSFEWGPYATLALSLVAVAASARFGGRIDDIRVRSGGSTGETLN